MIDFDELKQLCREATPGPWYEMPQHPYLFCNGRGPEPWHNDIIGRFDYNSEKDRAFIAAFRNAAPKLIAMAEQAAQWKKLYLHAVDEANHLTNFVEDGLVLRKAEARLDAIQAEARELSSKEQTS